ncbi:hypothetical protein ACFJGW_18965 [Burkholderiaceae bacterium UC74_6]
MQAVARQIRWTAVVLLGLCLSAVGHAQNMDCTTASDGADCTLTVSGTGRYVIEATANVTAGSNSPSVWVDTFVDGQQCGQRVTVTFSESDGTVRSHCYVTLESGRPYKITARAGNRNATAANVMLTYRSVNVPSTP